ncbi:MAG: hypothetical protein M0Z83_03535 [Betaproteobacteria bacterium]|nr:hypothetical protein [Betaproteobacteria bacterium]
MEQMWNHPLGRHILVMLLFKLLIIFAIWWFFFRPVAQVAPGNSDQVAIALLGTHVKSIKANAVPTPTTLKESLK